MTPRMIVLVLGLLALGEGAALAAETDLPATLRSALPAREAAVDAIDADPVVLRAIAEREAAQAQAGAYRRGSHDWVAGAQYASRDVDEMASSRRYDEWELSLQRGIRLPGKAEADRRLAAKTQEAAALGVADARHEAAVALLESWMAWRTALDAERIATAAAAIAAEDARIVTARVQSGDAAAAELDATRAAHAQARSAARMARVAAEEARIALASRFPGLALPAGPEALPEPALPATPLAGWAERVVEHNHEIELAQARAELAALAARRAGLERRADPVVGMRTLSERDGDEQSVGVFVSMPLGSGSRGFAAAEQAGLANAAAANAAEVHRTVQSHARSLLARAEGSLEAWQDAREGARAAESQRERLARGLALGGVRVAEMLDARRRLHEAERSEAAARAAALSAIARLMLDAHAYWIDDGDHPAGT